MKVDQHKFLQDGGEMAGLIAAYDWSASPLGSIDTWSDSLCTSLSTILRSRFPMLIFWGPKLITFYNDAFRPSLGNDGKHPGSLGQQGEVSWSESWPVIGPMIYDIMKGGKAVWFEDQKLPLYREGKMGYAYWTYSFSAISNKAGNIEGLLVNCTETTQVVEGLQRLTESRDELSFAIDATELGTWDLNPATGRFIANSRLKEWFGLKPDEEVPLTLALDVIEESDRQRVSDAINRTMEYSSGGRYETEYTIVNPKTNKKRLVLAKGRAWFGDDQIAYRLNGTLQDVTEQRLAEMEVRESELKFRSIIQEAPVATCFFTGTDHKITVANDRMLSVWGKKKSIIGLPIAVALPELIGQPFIDILDEIYLTGKPYSGTNAPADLEVDGKLQTFYFDFTYKPLFDKQGKVYGIMNMAVDVTSTVIARKALEEAELFSRSVIDNSPIAKIVFIGKEMTLKTVNRAMFELLGKDESIIGKTYFDVFPELKNTHFPTTMLQVFETGETYSQPEEQIQLIKDGKLETGYYSYIYKALRNTEGVIYGMIVTATEITNQVLARQKIEEAELRLNGAIELAELSTWGIDIKTKKISYSPRLQQWLGISNAVLTNNNTRVADSDRDRIMASLSESMVPGGKKFDEVYAIVNTQTGAERIIHAAAQLSYDELGEPLELVGVAQDITLQKKLQLELEREVQLRTEELATTNEELAATNEELAATNEELSTSNTSLSESNEELEQYAYVASHDLQEPLRKIQVFSTMLGEKEGLNPAHKTYIDKIKNSAERMSLLIKDLLEFSRLLSSGRSVNSEVDLNKVVQEIKNDFELLIAEKKAEIKIEKLPSINAMSLQMNQLFYNLIGNGLKFVKKGIQPHILISCKVLSTQELSMHIRKPLKSKTYYRISVADNGIGIDKDYIDQIFDVFKRLHGREEYSGSGIGLALCRRIVNNHGGHLYVESSAGEGSTFHVILPE